MIEPRPTECHFRGKGEDLAPGDLCRMVGGPNGDLVGYIHRCAGCRRLGNLADHTVTMDQGRITVEPSIVCPTCEAHYYVRDGRIDWCG